MVKGYKQYERQTLEAVTNARNQAVSVSGSGAAERARAEGELGGALTRLLAVMENYPDLKANQNFLALQQELTATENKISSARENYNNMVMRCNNLYQQFPPNMVAGLFGYKTEEFFEVKSSEERKAPEVSF
jgi:LemA protein